MTCPLIFLHVRLPSNLNEGQMMKRKSFTEEQIIRVLEVGAPKAAARAWATGTPNIVNVAVFPVNTYGTDLRL
jgi:hypothetical protein